MTIFFFFFKGKGSFLRCDSTSHAKLRHAAPHQSKQRKTEQNGAKLRLLLLKKNRCSSMRKPVPLFACEQSKKEPKVPQKCRDWVTPLFKSGISLLLNNGVNPMTTFLGNFALFFQKFSLKYFEKRRDVPRKHHLYFRIITQ